MPVENIKNILHLFQHIKISAERSSSSAGKYQNKTVKIFDAKAPPLVARFIPTSRFFLAWQRRAEQANKIEKNRQQIL